MSKIDSNRLHEDCVIQYDFNCPKHQQDIFNERLKKQVRMSDPEQCENASTSPKWQQDVDNQNWKKQTRLVVIDLEQCQDSGLPPSENWQLDLDCPLQMHHWETSIKIAYSSETSVKRNFDCAGDILRNKHSVSTHSRVVDLCQVEPMLEKGSLEAQISLKTSEDHAIKVKDVSEFESLLTEHAAKEEEAEEKEKDTHDLPNPVIQDTKNYNCDGETDHQRNERIISHTFSPESISESLTSASVKDPAYRSAKPQVKRTVIKYQHHKILTKRQHDWQKAWNSAKKAQIYAINIFTMKLSHPLMILSWYLYYEWNLPWLLPSKHTYSYRGEYSVHVFIGFLVDRTIGRAYGTVCRLSVICLSSVTFCIVAKRCILAKKCLKE